LRYGLRWRNVRHHLPAILRVITEEVGMGVAALGRWWSDWNAARAYHALGSDLKESLARDAGIPLDMLSRIASRGKSAGQELPRLLRALDLQPGDVRQRHPDVVRDMQAVCSTCAVVRRCRRDLARQVSRATFQTYCPNAQTIAALGERIRRKAACA
jgi:hypothetical protein